MKKQWKDTIYWLRDNFPSNTVVRCSRIKNWGGIEYKKGKFYIKINCNVPYSFRFESLLHEWAHALVWCDVEWAHTDQWGISYAKIYRTFYGWGFGE